MLWLATTQLNNTCDNRFTLCKKILRHLMSFFCWLESRPFGSNYICRIIHQLVNRNFLLLMVVLRKRNKETRKRTFPVKKDQFRDLWQMTESGVGYQRGEEVRFGGHGKLLVLPINSPPYPIWNWQPRVHLVFYSFYRKVAPRLLGERQGYLHLLLFLWRLFELVRFSPCVTCPH